MKRYYIQGLTDDNKIASITPAIFTLKSKRPEINADRTKIDLSHQIDVNISGLEVSRILDSSPKDIDFSEIE